MQGILRQESAASLVGGVNVMLIPQTTSRICMLQALSPVGRCKTLDASADGYGRGEALCVGLLAEATEQNAGAMKALVMGSAVQQNGQSSGLTAPNGPAQSALVRQAMLSNSISGDGIGAISMHGTGTPLGDPIEVGALASSLRGSHNNNTLTMGASKARGFYYYREVHYDCRVDIAAAMWCFFSQGNHHCRTMAY